MSLRGDAFARSNPPTIYNMEIASSLAEFTPRNDILFNSRYTIVPLKIICTLMHGHNKSQNYEYHDDYISATMIIAGIRITEEASVNFKSESRS